MEWWRNEHSPIPPCSARILRRTDVESPIASMAKNQPKMGCMKAIKVALDEGPLARLDADEEVRRHGRSAVIRHATAEYLRRRQRQLVAEQYVQAVGANAGLGSDFSGWEHEAK